MAAQPEEVRYLVITPMAAQPEEAGEDLLVVTSRNLSIYLSILLFIFTTNHLLFTT